MSGIGESRYRFFLYSFKKLFQKAAGFQRLRVIDYYNGNLFHFE